MKIVDDSFINGIINEFQLVENLPMSSVKNILGTLLMRSNRELIKRIMNGDIDGLGTAFIKAKGEK